MWHINKQALVSLLLVLLIGNNPCSIAAEITVASVEELNRAISYANKNKQPDIIIVLPGQYNLTKRLQFAEPNTTLRGATGVASDVVFSGRGMKRHPQVEVLVDVQGDNITLSGLVLQNAGNHLIQVRAEKDADNFSLSNCILRDAYEQLLKVSGGKTPSHPYSDNGVVSHCVFEYTAGIGPQYYIGGIDAHRIRNWRIENNRFYGIASPADKVAEHAIHIWNDSSDNMVINNTIINCDRGIGFGMGNLPKQNSGGIISNNLIVHTAREHPYADVGIILESSPNTQVMNNTIMLHHNYPNAIEYRFSRTQNAIITNNIVNKRISARNGGKADLKDNKKL